MTVRNRLVMSPMETMYGTPDGLPSERTRDYFAARANGGVGLITVGATGIDHHHPETPGGLHLGTDAAVDAHRALVEALHEHGAKIQPQIVHAGPDGLGPEMYGVTSIGPSVIPSYLTGRPSAEVTREQWSRCSTCSRPRCGARPKPGTAASNCMPRMATCSSARFWRRSVTAAPTNTVATR